MPWTRRVVIELAHYSCADLSSTRSSAESSSEHRGPHAGPPRASALLLVADRKSCEAGSSPTCTTTRPGVDALAPPSVRAHSRGHLCRPSSPGSAFAVALPSRSFAVPVVVRVMSHGSSSSCPSSVCRYGAIESEGSVDGEAILRAISCRDMNHEHESAWFLGLSVAIDQQAADSLNRRGIAFAHLLDRQYIAGRCGLVGLEASPSRPCGTRARSARWWDDPVGQTELLAVGLQPARLRLEDRASRGPALDVEHEGQEALGRHRRRDERVRCGRWPRVSGSPAARDRRSSRVWRRKWIRRRSRPSRRASPRPWRWGRGRRLPVHRGPARHSQASKTPG